MGLLIRKAKNLALGMVLSQSEANKSAEDTIVEKGDKFLVAKAAGDGEKSASEVTDYGYFLLGLVLLGFPFRGDSGWLVLA